jgi:tetratricopeptide (TPR) repeat protein
MGKEIIMNELFIKGVIHANELRFSSDTNGKPDLYLNNIKSALEIYKNILNENGEDTFILYAMSSCYARWAEVSPKDFIKWEDAIRTITKAIQKTPDNGFFHASLASYYHFGTLEYEKAVIEYKKAIELNPSDLWSLNNLAGLYGVPENVITIQEAISLRARVVSLEPINPLHHALLADVYFKNHQYQEAQDEAIKSLLSPRPLDAVWVNKIREILDKINEVANKKIS